MIVIKLLGFSVRILTVSLVLANAVMMFSSSVVQAGVESEGKASVSTRNKQARGQVPGRRRGGARRGECPATSTDLTALAPVTEVTTQNLPETYVGGTTTVGHPTFWFYVPYSLDTALTAEFILQDETGQDIYRTNSTEFSTSEQTPGIISISLPFTIAPLEIGKDYQWYFKLNCAAESLVYVQGGIERIPLDANLASQLDNATPQAQADLYQANGIWYDAITTLGNLYRANPTDTTVASDWISLLQSIGLGDIPIN